MGWGGLDRLPCRAQAKLDWAGLLKDTNLIYDGVKVILP